MKRRLLDIVRCPIDGSAFDLEVFTSTTENFDPDKCPLRLVREMDDAALQRLYGEEILEGALISRDAGNVYPIIAGVPRLIPHAARDYPEFFRKYRTALKGKLPDAHLAQLAGRDRRSPKSFGLQWNRYQFEDRTWFKDLALRQREFLHSMGVARGQLAGHLVLDAGCGHGALTAALAVHGVEAVGLDFTVAVERAQQNRARFAGELAPFVHYIQGDLLQPPLAPECFDHAHSSGVIHHTPDPRGAFASLVRVTRPGGRVYVQVYRKRERWVAVSNAIVRAVTTRLPPRLLWALCLPAVPVHTVLVYLVAALRHERPMLADSTLRERAVSLFDNFSPRYQFRYRPEEIRQFFVDSGLGEIEDTTLANEMRHMVAFVGVKPPVRVPVKAGAKMATA
ncbi:MAG TPA: methyltransferase domain-containing protein [Gammaproteobacteria bacterium]|nr:methyltransferase domain-containing protein [Gammaproteobacteria bacterium]